MGDVLYMQTDKNRKITDPHVRLGDISDLTSNNPEVLQRCKVLRVLTLESGKYGRKKRNRWKWFMSVNRSLS